VALPLTIYLLIVGLADNILKPMLMGRGLSTPMLVIFVGVLGGMLAHGIVGLFIGPIILAVAWELMTAWIREDQAGAISPDARRRRRKTRRRRLAFRTRPVAAVFPAGQTRQECEDASSERRAPLTYVKGLFRPRAILMRGLR